MKKKSSRKRLPKFTPTHFYLFSFHNTDPNGSLAAARATLCDEKAFTVVEAIISLESSGQFRGSIVPLSFIEISEAAYHLFNSYSSGAYAPPSNNLT